MGLFSRYLEGTQGAAICFDLTELYTLDLLPDWINLLPECIPMILLGLKADLLDVPFDDEEVVPLIESYPFIEFCLASAKDPYTVHHAFQKLASYAFTAVIDI